MKQLLVIITCSICLLFTACAKEDKTCSAGFTGSDCTQELTPKKIKVTKIQIQKFTTTNPSGLQWDPSEAGVNRLPDILIAIVRGGIEKTSASFSPNCELAGVPYTINFTNPSVAGSGEFTLDLGSLYTLRFYDFDYSMGQELMKEATFKFYTAGQKFPKTLRVESADSQFACDLNLEYTFE